MVTLLDIVYLSVMLYALNLSLVTAQYCWAGLAIDRDMNKEYGIQWRNGYFILPINWAINTENVT